MAGNDWTKEVGVWKGEQDPPPNVEHDKRKEFYIKRVEFKLNKEFTDIIKDLSTNGYKTLKEHEGHDFNQKVQSGDTLFQFLKNYYSAFPEMTAEQAEKESYLSLAYIMEQTASSKGNVDDLKVDGTVVIANGFLTTLDAAGVAKISNVALRPPEGSAGSTETATPEPGELLTNETDLDVDKSVIATEEPLEVAPAAIIPAVVMPPAEQTPPTPTETVPLVETTPEQTDKYSIENLKSIISKQGFTSIDSGADFYVSNADGYIYFNAYYYGDPKVEVNLAGLNLVEKSAVAEKLRQALQELRAEESPEEFVDIDVDTDTDLNADTDTDTNLDTDTDAGVHSNEVTPEPNTVAVETPQATEVQTPTEPQSTPEPAPVTPLASEVVEAVSTATEYSDQDLKNIVRDQGLIGISSGTEFYVSTMDQKIYFNAYYYGNPAVRLNTEGLDAAGKTTLASRLGQVLSQLRAEEEAAPTATIETTELSTELFKKVKTNLPADRMSEVEGRLAEIAAEFNAADAKELKIVVLEEESQEKLQIEGEEYLVVNLNEFSSTNVRKIKESLGLSD